MKKVIVVSAVNLVEAGPLTILKRCLEYLSSQLSNDFEIIALVNSKDLFSFEGIRYLEFPKSKKSWINRLYYEYCYFSRLSKKLDPFLWLSLHDITPNVKAKRLATYCHNASPFYKLPFKEMLLDPRFALFNIFYKYLYLINIKKNDFLIVQQDCLRRRFSDLINKERIVVSYLNDDKGNKSESFAEIKNTFFYPSFPRVFKNFEVIGYAADILSRKGISDFKVIFTISGKENWYSRRIYNSFRHLKNIRFIGIQEKNEVYSLYKASSCVIFPSKLETWGIPITEAKSFSKPILLADLEYAHETLGEYDKAKFFNPANPRELADAMQGIINGKIIFDKTKLRSIPKPFSQSWEELFNILLHADRLRGAVK